MKIEEKLLHPEGENCFKEIWPNDLVFKLAWSIFKPDQDIIKNNFLVKFLEDWSKTVASKGWTRFYKKKDPVT